MPTGTGLISLGDIRLICFPSDVMNRDLFHDFLSGVAQQVPYLIAYAIGIALALAYRRRYPLPCLMILFACTIKVATALASPFSAALLLAQGDFRTFEYVTLLLGVIEAGAYVMILLAVILGRASQERRIPRAEEPLSWT
jgi:hypothetical protein